MRKINGERLPQKMLEWCPPGRKRRRRRRRRRPQNSWLKEVITGMRETGNNSMEWIEKKEWRRKIKLLACKDEKILILYIK